MSTFTVQFRQGDQTVEVDVAAASPEAASRDVCNTEHVLPNTVISVSEVPIDRDILGYSI